MVSDEWCAGVFEARARLHPNWDTREPVLSIHVPERTIVAALQYRFGAGDLELHFPRHRLGQSYWAYTLRGDDALKALECTYPHMISPTARITKIVLGNYKEAA